MNKKLLLLSALTVLTFGQVKAQSTTVLSQNFEGEITGWTLIDADGDNNNWIIMDNSETDNRPDLVAGGKMAASFSYDNDSGPLTPNNYLVSPVINLSAHAGKTVKLKWKVSAQDKDWNQEKYTVYAANANTAAAFLASSVKMTETSAPITLTTKELDLTSFAGQAEVYVAFRHYESSDQFAIVVDDILVEATSGASTADFFKSNFSLYPNPASDVLNIDSRNGIEVTSVQIIDMMGRVVKTQKGGTSIQVSDLAAGSYAIEIQSENGKATSKFVKK